MHMNVRFLCGTILLTLIAMTRFISPCYADSGDRALRIICDKKADYFEVEPFIMWNEELDAFLKQNPRGTKKEGIKLTHVF